MQYNNFYNFLFGNPITQPERKKLIHTIFIIFTLTSHTLTLNKNKRKLLFSWQISTIWPRSN